MTITSALEITSIGVLNKHNFSSQEKRDILERQQAAQNSFFEISFLRLNQIGFVCRFKRFSSKPLNQRENCVEV